MKPFITTIEGGTNRGKKILLIAGVHGNEVNPVFTVATAIKNKLFDVQRLHSLTIINGVNISGLENNTRDIVPNNTYDLNRMLVDVPELTPDALLKVYIKHSDIVIDLHSSENCTEFVLVDIDEYATLIQDWCKKAEVKCAFRYSDNNTIKRYCFEQGKIGITIEMNSLLKIDTASGYHTTNIINALLKTSEDVVLTDVVHNPTVHQLEEIKTYKSGIVTTKLVPGERFKYGDTLAVIFDLEYNKICDIVANVSGWVVMETASFVNRGDTILLVQPE